MAGKCRHISLVPSLSKKFQFDTERPVLLHTCGRIVPIREFLLHTNFEQIGKELKIISILEKLLEYKISWIQHVKRMPNNRLPRVMKYYSPNW